MAKLHNATTLYVGNLYDHRATTQHATTLLTIAGHFTRPRSKSMSFSQSMTKLYSTPMNRPDSDYLDAARSSVW